MAVTGSGHEHLHVVLIADDDQVIGKAMSAFFKQKGFKTITARDGEEALEIFKDKRPSIVVADLRMPKMEGGELLRKAREIDADTPFIIMTGHPDMNSAIDAIHHGAYDYIVKPFQPELLFQKVTQALSATDLERENSVLSKLALLHEIGNRLASTHDLSKVLDISIDAILDVLDAENGSIQLVDKGPRELVLVRHKGISPKVERSALSNHDEWPVSKWVATHGQPMLIVGEKTIPQVGLPLSRDDVSSSLSIPLMVGEEILGVMNLNRKKKNNPFTPMDRKTAEVFAAEVSIAINNAILYSSIKQKLNELSLIGNYSEQLTGVVDVPEVVNCLFETVRRHFPVDIIGFLVVKRRFHDFLYWARGKVPEEIIEKIISATLAKYNKTANSRIQLKRVTPRILGSEQSKRAPISTPLRFEHIVPVILNSEGFGAVYVGAATDMDDKDEKVSLLSSLVNQTRISLTNAKLYNDVKENYIRTIKALAIAVDAKDTYTHGHSENVMNIAEAMAVEMNLDETVIGTIRDAGLLHDIGKIGIPGYILNKPGPLTYEEFNGVMKTHTTMGANIVKDVPFLRDLSSLILSHHEHFDGSGYPGGLKKEDIPLGARILHVADAYEAMTSNRPYRNSLGKKEAIKRLTEQKGKQFDPGIVDVFINVARKKGWLD